MAYTVNKLAKLSGVSIRTLRFYDEIGLLKPAYVGDNQYRYYEEPQLMLLQQILFYRELGFPLRDIQDIISNPDFDKVKALESHRKTLEKNLDQTNQLIATIDKTIAYLRGNKTVKLEEIFHGFSDQKQKMYEDFLVESGVEQKMIDHTKSTIKNWTKEQWLENKAEMDKVHADLVDAIKRKLDPGSPEVQANIARHYQITKKFWTPNRETFIGLSQFYGSHPDFVAFYAALHPDFLEYLTKAMKIYAERNL